MADTIRILVATDNHVGAHERHPIRSDDSWRSFHEIMCLAKEREVDMVLLAGDLFHDNVPSRKSMYKVMQSIRQNCLGPRPCELEMLGDNCEHFDPYFGHVNYEDPDINVSIPVFSIHGNHDDPSGEGHFSALDILSVSGLINYFGRASNSDEIDVKPVLIQKGITKLALYGLSNVRDERLWHTFRDGKVRFYQPGIQPKDWFQLVCVHQNHVPHTGTSYLPENFLPQFLDLVIWGHEHDCRIEPQYNPEMDFKVIQPGSSIATSLSVGETIPKHVTILSITGREFKSEPIRLKSVRPFVYRDIVLAEDKAAVKIGKQDNHRTKLTQYLMSIVDEMIDEANKQWQEAHPGRVEDDLPEDELEEEDRIKRLKERAPLIRLRVEVSMPSGLDKFQVENPQRFSHRFHDRVANTNDLVQFYQKKRNAQSTRQIRDTEADQEIMAKFTQGEEIKVGELVKEFLDAQSLTILPQNLFGESVVQYVDKGNKHAMESFVTESLANQIKELAMEAQFAKGKLKIKKNAASLKPKPPDWNSDFDGSWEDHPGALIRSDEEDGNSDNHSENGDDDDNSDGAPKRGAKTARARGRGGRRGAASSRGTTTRGRKRAVASASSEEEPFDNDVVMLDDDDSDDNHANIIDDDEESDSQALFFPSANSSAPKKKNNTRTTSSATRSNGTGGAKSKSTRLTSAATAGAATKRSAAKPATTSEAILN
ncbi:hypothetical protein DV738_g4963, partial [Chaetothyriales sp. CBS 135597]